MNEVPFDAEGRYLVRGILGSGAFGVVHRVLDTKWDQELALKTLRNPSPEVRQWLKAEYRHLRDIVHPNLVRLHELHVDGGQCFFTMDVVEAAQPFNRRFDFDRDGPREQQELAVRRVCRAGAQLFDALRTVHALGKCHRDIKPSNILVTEPDRVVLLDFGMASPVDRSRDLDTTRGALVGTLVYMAPEQYLSPSPLPASDAYSASLVIYETIAGRFPFAGDAAQIAAAKHRPSLRLAELIPAAAGVLDELLFALLDPDPTRRPSSREAFVTLRALGEESTAPSTWRSRSMDDGEIFVERERELATLELAYQSTLRGRFTAVDIVGPSGIGKTTLVRRFLDGIAGARPLVLEARCHPHESIPYKAFDAAIDDLTRHWVGLDDDEANALCPDDGAGALTVLFPELRRVPVLDLPRLEQRSDPPALRRSGFQALRSVLVELRKRMPVVVWTDDVQWADADSAALVAEVFGGDAPPAVLLIVSRRPETSTEGPTVYTAIAEATPGDVRHTIELTPFSSDSARRLVDSILDAGSGDAQTIEAILHEAAGVPYLVSGLAHFVAARADATRATTGSLLHEQLSSLLPADRRVLEVAALCGSPQPAEILLAAAGEGDRSRLRDLCLLRLLRWTGTPDETKFLIYHDRLGQSVTAGLPDATKAAHHLALVTALESAGSSDAEQMMNHAKEANDVARVRRHAAAAAERADAALAFDQAVRLYQLALADTDDGPATSELRERLADALANAGQSKAAAPEFERACAAIDDAEPTAIARRLQLRRRAAEQYLKAGLYEGGMRLMEESLGEAGISLPKTGSGALAVSLARRTRLYLRGFEFEPRAAAEIPPAVRSRLRDLWQLTTSMSMMDPVRADGVGLLHFLEALKAGAADHVANALGYEAAFASLIGGDYMRRKARDLLERNRKALEGGAAPYDRAFFRLSSGTAAFFMSEWDRAAALCDEAAAGFRRECRGAEYEAAVSLVFGLQALGLAGNVSQLVVRIPEAIREADARGDIFAANNYRAGYHALGRIAAGLIDDVCADLERVVETWGRGFYQMHQYHRVFAGVAADLYLGNATGAVTRIEHDWPELRAGLFLRMELPAAELRWTRARASLAAAIDGDAKTRKVMLARVTGLVREIERSSVPAARPHGALLRAGIAALEGQAARAVAQLRIALAGYEAAHMAIHREVTRWTLARLLHDDALRDEAQAWMHAESVPDMPRLVAAIAPGVALV